jgi:hypothetical protein
VVVKQWTGKSFGVHDGHRATAVAILVFACSTLVAAPVGGEPAGEGGELGPTLIFVDDFEGGGLCVWSDGGGWPAALCPYEFFCAGLPSPVTASDPVTLAGTLSDVVATNPISGATISARRRSDDVLLDSDTTTAAGEFSLSSTTGGVPLDAYLAMTATGYPASFVYPTDPLTADELNFGARALTSSNLNLAYLLSGVVHASGTGTTVVLVVDCLGVPIEGATVAFVPSAGALRYLVGGVPSNSATSTDASGAALGLNAPAGESTVQANYSSTALESHSFESQPDGLSFTLIHP